MDELAYATGVDPVELRLRNDTDIDPYSGRPFSTRASRECLTKGAARFGWDKRKPEAPVDARRPLSHRPRSGGSDLHTLAMARKGAGHAKRRWLGARRSRRARHRHGHLHGDGSRSLPTHSGSHRTE